jgi:hypothetical protein
LFPSLDNLRWQCLCCCAAFLVATSAWAQPSGGSVSVERLEEALGQYFSSDSKAAPAGLIFVGATRVGPAFGLPADGSAQTSALIDRLANPAIRAPLTIETVGSIYEYILTFRELPPFRYSPEDRRTFNRLNGILFKHRGFVCIFVDWLTNQSPPPRKPSRAYTRYFEFAQKVAEAKDRYNAAQAGHEDTEKVARYSQELDDLQERWRTAGRKDKIEHAIDEYQNLTAKNPVKIWNKLAANYSEFIQTVGSSRFPKTDLDPDVATWSNNVGWEGVSVATNDGRSTLVRIKRVQVLRPWLDEQVFGGLSWGWMRSAPLGQDHVVSDGKGLSTLMTKSKTIGLMPRQLVIATYATDNGGWPGSGFLAGYLASRVPVTPRQ